MANHKEVVKSQDFRDRKTGLVVFGILEIILGVFCMFVAFGIFVARIKSSAGPMSVGTIMPGVFLYGFLAVWYIWMGIGSIKARRWARALLLVFSWIFLISGIGGLIFMIGLMSKIHMIFEYVMLGFMAVFSVIIPGALVLFYGSKNVKATCEFRDPLVRWTDTCPLPVLAVSLIYILGAGSMLLMGLNGWVIPFFGRILSGMAGAGVALVYILLFCYVAWGTYKLKIEAWWCAVFVALVLWGISTVITFSRVSLLDFYEKMNFPEQQLEIMKQYAMPQYFMALFIGVWVVVFLGYLLYTKRYFISPSTKEDESDQIN